MLEKKGNLFLGAVGQGIMWGLWKERNGRIFGREKLELWVVRDAISREAGSCMLISSEFHDVLMNDFLHDWTACISPLLILCSRGQVRSGLPHRRITSSLILMVQLMEI